jgi:hypothetical protein
MVFTYKYSLLQAVDTPLYNFVPILFPVFVDGWMDGWMDVGHDDDA